MKKLMLEAWYQCVVLLTQGQSQRQVALQVGCSREAVQLAWRRYQQAGNEEDLARSGQPRKITRADDCTLIRNSMRGRRRTA